MSKDYEYTGMIPRELRFLKGRWVVWRLEGNDGKGKPRKVPYNAATHKRASVSTEDSSDWVDFQIAWNAYCASRGRYDGVGFVLSKDDDIICFDIDRCRNKKNKTLTIKAQRFVKASNSYTEISHGEDGVHIFVRGKKPGEACRNGNVECYEHSRYIAMTGRRLKTVSAKVEHRQTEIDVIYQQEFTNKAISQSGGDRAVPNVPVPEDKLKKLLKQQKARAIYEGRWSDYGYPSQSEAELALASIAIANGWTDGEIKALLQAAREHSGAKSKPDSYYERTIHVARGVKPVSLEHARSVFQRWLHLPDVSVLDVVLAVTASSHLPADPAWLHIVAPPSSGKTETINAIQSWPTVYALTELTPAGLVSGINSEDGEDHSLMPKLDGKTLAIKDFTPTIDAPQDQRNRQFALLRDAFDGSTARHTAMVGTRAHRAKFNCLTGVTNSIEKVWRNTSLGERYLLFRMEAGDSARAARQALDGATIKDQMRQELSDAACGVLAGINLDVVPTASGEIKDVIVNLASALARARAFIERSRDHHVECAPQPEGPARIAQQLFKLGQGLALINQRTELNHDDLILLRRVALDSIPLNRRRVLDVLLDAEQPVLAKYIQQQVQLSQPVVAERLGELAMLGILKKTAKGANVLHYSLRRDFRALLNIDGMARRHGTVGSKVRNSSTKFRTLKSKRAPK